MPGDGFISIWSYRVAPGKAEEFRRLYGPDGDWVQLFRMAAGYVSTELLEGVDDRFVTLDRWESEGAFREFKERFHAEYERLDRIGERLTIDEMPIGEFQSI